MAKATQQVFAEDMSEEKVDFCLEIATDAFNQASFQGKVYSYVANFIRAALEKQYGKGWNVVVGKSFGAFVTHEIKTYFYGSVVPGVCVLIWRCEGEPRNATGTACRSASRPRTSRVASARRLKIALPLGARLRWSF